MSYSFKILFLGNTGSGKTSIINVSNNNEFSHLFTSTIGVDFTNLNVEKDGKLYQLKVWDTGGHDRFQFLIKSYFRNLTAVVIVYDITNIRSYDNIEGIIRNYKRYSDNPNIPMLILGNKTDLEKKREISHANGKYLADKHDCAFLECSARNHHNIENIYFTLIDKINKDLNVNGEDIEKGIRFYKKNSITTLNIEETGTLKEPKACCNIL